jgi:hypothetical protein
MKTFNKTLIDATTIATFGLAAAPAALSVEASAGLATSYLFRGAEMSSGTPVVWGDVSSSTAGVTYGAWVSSGDSQTEYDLYLDYSGSVGDIGYSVGYVDYNYATTPDESNLEETYVGLSYGPLSVTVYNDTGSDADYTSVSYSAGAFTFTYGDATSVVDAVEAVEAVAGSDATVTADEDADGNLTGTYTFTPAVAAVEAVEAVAAGTSSSTHFDVSYAVNDSLTFTVSKPEDADAIVVASYSLPF